MQSTVRSSNVLETAREAGAFTTFLDAVDRAGLDAVLAGEGPFTLFVPSDEAFTLWPPGAVDWLLAEPRTLADVVSYHVVHGRVTAAEAVTLRAAATVQGEELFVSANGCVRVDGARLIRTDIEASNGLIHVVDRVLLPARL